LLSKREYLYRQFLGSKLSVHSLPKSFTVSPQNTLLRELQSSYSFIDPTTYSSEATREFLYKNPKFVHYLFIKDFLRVTNKIFLGLNINFDSLSNYFIQLMGYRNDYKALNRNASLYKSQYRPMKKGVVNMLRLQATNAIAMPTEIRLHILASSKDVIHSWAIPSAGIKIDCVPGYSSHRIAIFLTHGIFWGQCMEICGRYHH
jgi:heme/copper-type cytochrome/quinol oxidase subunit 2